MPAWTYTEDLTGNRRDLVRHLIGDTDEDDKVLFDHEIDFHLSRHANNYLAAAECCEVAATRYIRTIMRRSGTLELNLQGQNFWSDRAKQLRDLADDGTGPVLAGAFFASSNVRPPMFWLGMNDNPTNDAFHYPASPGSGVGDAPAEVGGP